MVPYRQPIYPGDKGLDVFAVRRALRRRGHKQLPAVGYTYGPSMVDAIRAVQRYNHLKADGIYGPATHAVVAQSFDRYGAWLYARARIRVHYFNPFRRASIVAGRTDMGVDYHGTGPIDAIGDATVIGNGGAGWPGGHYLLYRLENGPHAGRHVYVAEAIIPTVGGGQKVKAGQQIALFGPGAHDGFYPGIETGWSSPTLNLTLAAAMGETGGVGHADSPAGECFARFLRRLGAPTQENPGPGPEYPSPPV